MSDLPLGNVPLSILDDSDNIIFTEGQYAKKISYSDVKTDMLGSANLATTASKTKEAINELVQDLLESTGCGVVSGLAVSAQATPNMTVNVAAGILKTATGARQVISANAALAITTANTTNPRIDIVYISSAGVISYLQGTAAASPTAPSTPNGGTLLAQINIAANQTTIANSNITDYRKMLISTDWLNSQLSDITLNRGYLTTKVVTDTDFNNLISNGKYKITNGTANVPDASTQNTFLIDVFAMSSSYIFQIAYCMYSGAGNTGKMYIRYCTNGTWQAWKQIATTESTESAITLLTGWTSIGSTYTYCRKNNKVVHINMLITNPSATNVNDYIAQVDASVKPPYNVSISIINKATGAISPGYLNASGYIYPAITGLSANTQYYISVCYEL